MKKTILLLLSAILLISQTACNTSDSGTKSASIMPNESEDTSVEQSKVNETETSSAETSVIKATEAAVATTEPQKKECPYDYEQKLEVAAKGSFADLILYEWNGVRWETVWTAEGCVGNDGVSDKNSNDNYMTPEGTFDISFCFGLEKPDTKLDFKQIKPGMVWVDDTSSEYYNCLTTSDKAGSVSYEDTYSLFTDGYFSTNIYFENNGDGLTPGSASPDKSSVITICGYEKTLEPTYGCIDISSSDMESLLKLLDSNKHPVINISKLSETSVSENNIIDISGMWYQENLEGYNKVYSMEIADEGNGDYLVMIEFAEGASLTDVYSFYGHMDSDGTIYYSNGMFGITSYSESGEKHESYKAGISGKLSISDDCLYWSCDYDVPDYPSISDVKFIRSNM